LARRHRFRAFRCGCKRNHRRAGHAGILALPRPDRAGGNGRAFSSGADVHQRQLRKREEFLEHGGPQGWGANSGDLLTRSVNWKPVIAAPHGYAMGLALGIVLDAI